MSINSSFDTSLNDTLLDGRHTRTQCLIGEEAVDKLCKSTVAVFGLGGVGSYIVEALARSGIQNFVLVDKDVVCESNINRQLVATYHTIGTKKTEIAKAHILSINPQAQVICYPIFYGKDTYNTVDLSTTDYIADAIDNITGKLLLVETAKKMNIPIISSMGTGNKLDPSQFRIADISNTSVCPLARVMRHELKKRKIEKLTVVYSQEKPYAVLPSQSPASISFVPAIAGLLIASKIIKDLAGLQ